MSLLHKKEDTTNINNYRPLSLTGVDYKILTYILAEKVQKILKQITNTDQKGLSRVSLLDIYILTCLFVFNSVEVFNYSIGWTCWALFQQVLLRRMKTILNSILSTIVSHFWGGKM